MYRYKRAVSTNETITKTSYKPTLTIPVRGSGTRTIIDRYKTSAPSYAVPEYNYPQRTVIINENWQQPYVDPLTVITVALQQSYGSRYRIAGTAQSGNKLIVIQNPTGPLVQTNRGLQVTENNARLGRFIAQMNAASVVRRRRGQ